MAHGRDPISHPIDDNDSDLGSDTLAKSWGNLRAGNHLTMRRQALDDWRYDCWKRNHQFCTFGEVGVMSDTVLATLASSTKIETIDKFLEAVPRWGYARKYGHEVLSVLEDANHKHKLESQAQRTKVRQANQKRKREDLHGDEEQKPLRTLVQPHSYTTPPTSANTRMITPIIVKHVEQPTRPQLPCPRPRRSRPQPQPILTPHPYIRTDAFDVLTENLRRM